MSACYIRISPVIKEGYTAYPSARNLFFYKWSEMLDTDDEMKKYYSEHVTSINWKHYTPLSVIIFVRSLVNLHWK